MLELPEAAVISCQLQELIGGKRILNVTAGKTPHKFAWFFGDPEGYHALLAGKTVEEARAYGGHVELKIGDCRLSFNDGVNLRYLAPGEEHPKRHQLLLEFEDFSALAATVQMYGGLYAFREGENDSFYYLVSREKPSPLCEGFDEGYFLSLCGCEDYEKLSAKAFLATGQRIPGLGNGVLQDILFRAGLSPRQRMGALGTEELSRLFDSLKVTLAEMTLAGGRDTERDLFGCKGGYRCLMGKNTAGNPCPVCGERIVKETYLGGSVYYCPNCQPIKKGE